MQEIDLAVIGGGPAGMAAAVEACKNGIENIVILEREGRLGGILKQCIHNGFGLHFFKEELTGPEYAWRFEEQVRKMGIDIKLETTVLHISGDRTITAVNGNDGVFRLKPKAVVLAMGCRERSRGALNIPGMRPAGIYSAGTAQRFVNVDGYLPGKKVVILGSGDIGFIMARRMTLEGAEVRMVCELMPYSGGLTRNIVQCLDDFGIPLKLSHTVVKIHGRDRLEGVTIAEVDSNRIPRMETAQYVECDTLLLSVGLIPENELSRDAGIKLDNITMGPQVDESMETSMDGVFACGNVVHVHDLVDNVTREAMVAGRCAARYILGTNREAAENTLRTAAGNGVRYVVPQTLRRSFEGDGITLFFRVDNIYKNREIAIRSGGRTVYKTSRKRMVPGEMESVTLSRKLMDSIGDSDEITVQVAKPQFTGGEV